jgi:hypothetical protein
LIAAVLVGVIASGARADVTTEQSASILVFPKVIADGTRETVIQITNTSNAMVHAHCFYVNGGLTLPNGLDGIPDSGDEFASPLNPPLWTEIDFDIWLTKQQPTYWVVSKGRLVNSEDESCTRQDTSCPDSGFDPGRVPPVVENFTGELKCVEVDASGAPLGGNHLKGEATILTVQQCDVPLGEGIGVCRGTTIPCEAAAECPGTTGDAAKYNALGIIGLENNNGDGVLCLGGESGPECEFGAEYNACPQTWILNHLSGGAEDPVGGGDSEVNTSIAVVPCAQNFETQVPETVTIQFAIINEFEIVFSTSTSVTCWAELDLVDDISTIFSRDSLGSDFVQTFMRPATGTNSGFMVVATEDHNDDESLSSASANLHVIGQRTGTDKIVIPAEQVAP